MKKLIVSFVLIISFLGCEKDKVVEYSSSLIGEWSWISSCGGLAYTCYTPKSTNHKINLVFTTDSLYIIYRNDTLILSTKFQTYISPTSNFPGIADVIKYNNSSIQEEFSIVHDTLFLNDFCCDGFNSNYKRIK
jgi:uncharacterized lipoprotein YehR (DUF1307 family)